MLSFSKFISYLTQLSFGSFLYQYRWQQQETQALRKGTKSKMDLNTLYRIGRRTGGRVVKCLASVDTALE